MSPNYMRTGINIDWEKFDPKQPLAIPVSSSCISYIYWNPISMNAEATFVKDGRQYRYYGIPLTVLLEWIQSSSVGRYFNYQIRGNFPYREL